MITILHDEHLIAIKGVYIIYGLSNNSFSPEKCRVNTDPFLHRIYTIGLYTI